MKKTISLILALTGMMVCRAQSINLSMNLEKGKTYKQVSDTRTTIDQTVNGKTNNIVMTTKGTIAFLVQSDSIHVYNMSVYFETLGMTMQTPYGPLEFSSEKDDENDIFSKILAAMKNKPFEVKMDKKGKVLEVKNIDSIWDTIIGQFNQIPEVQRKQVCTQIKKAYGEKALIGSIESGTAIFPETTIKKGDKWDNTVQIEAGMAATVNNEYELADFTPEYVLIKANSTLKTDDKDEYVETNGMLTKYDMTGSSVSTIKIDRTTGWVINTQIHQEMKGDANIKTTQQIPNGIKIPTIIISESVITD